MSHSESRTREAFIGLRLTDAEKAELQGWAGQLGVTAPEMLRAWLFGHEITERPRCSRHHPSCTTQHHELVQGYRLDRHNQEIALENATGLRPGELQVWRENGGKLPTFAEWLRGQRRKDTPHDTSKR